MSICHVILNSGRIGRVAAFNYDKFEIFFQKKMRWMFDYIQESIRGMELEGKIGIEPSWYSPAT